LALGVAYKEDLTKILQFSVWVRPEEFLTLKTSLQLEIKEAFD
jgi:hypothetical protein